jgi:hypothetical protein
MQMASAIQLILVMAAVVGRPGSAGLLDRDAIFTQKIYL